MFLVLLVVALVAPALASVGWDEEGCGLSIYPDAGWDQDWPGDTPFIVNGWDARPHEFPWMGSLKYLGSLSCGAVIIGRRWAITAAHCSVNRDPSTLTLVVGQHDRSDADNEPNRIVHEIEVNTIHEDYNTASSYDNDIAVLRTTEDINLYENVSSPCKPAGGYDGVTGSISGWGRLSQGGPLGTILQYVNNPIVAQADCDGDCFPSGYIYPGMMCFGYCGSNNRSTCNGDSGGPLVTRTADDSFDLIGLTSWNLGGCVSQYPKVFTNVSYFVDWVDENAQPWE